MKRFKVAGITIILALLISIVTLLTGDREWVIAISNIYFIVGLFTLVVAAFILILSGHLFTGWRRMRRRGDDADLPDEKVPARKVGRLKNAPIKVSRPASYCLQVAIPLIVISVLITLI
ncbi:DUF3899 domain-containing protein [Nicoliella lavandulae]|uniref:DUF3899 domain-containing protein n=1 Tax=Nicoliella lavandulae TaxID=3082954 RepID=A0ABU8SJS4_9LACO